MKRLKHIYDVLCNKMERLSSALAVLPCLMLIMLVMSCARMGQPDGGWYDETPPKIVSTSPAEGSVNVKGKKIYINFDEFVKIDNPSEKVVISPPQIETPDIKGQGKRIVVELKDSLKPNTTYTIDFSDAITDFNEDNPLGNYAYTFSTSDVIDTMEVSGYVLEASNLEPIKGITVGLYDNHSDTIFRKAPMMRISRTDSRGHFVIKGIAPGSYRIYALKDVDGDYMFTQKSEEMAFSHDLITPTSKPDIRQDTLWTDTLHIHSIERVGYTHFLPDDIVLRAFTEELTDRYFIKSDRSEADHFSLYFSYGNPELPRIKGIDFDETNAFFTEYTPKKDSITYWLRDTTLINKDTLNVQMQYMMTDSAGVLQLQTDTLQLLAKQSYAKRMKQKEKLFEDWQKKQTKAKKRGERYDSIMPPKPLELDIDAPSKIDPDKNIAFNFKSPIAAVDTSKIHLYSKHDTVWYIAPYVFKPVERKDSLGKEVMTVISQREYQLFAEWHPGIEYSLEIDSLAFTDIYGITSAKTKKGFAVKSDDEYSTILLTIMGMQGKNIVVQLLDSSDKMVKETRSTNGTAEFFYVDPKKYYVRMFVDANNNGKWDIGDYDTGKQPEDVYYYPNAIECRAKWDITETWNPMAKPLYGQKPSEITKQKTDKQKTIKNRNLRRAQSMGIDYIEKNR